MTTATAFDTVPAHQATSLSALAQQVLAVLYQHRLMSTGQLHRLLTPHTARPVYLLRELGRLKTSGWVENVYAHGGRRNNAPLLWYLAEDGYDRMDTASETITRSHRMTADAACGPRQAHTLAVGEVGTALVEHARRLGHECGPLYWMPEVAHRIRTGSRRFEDDHVISDALVDYVHPAATGKRTAIKAFIELDRATMPVSRLAQKIAAYARLYEYAPDNDTSGRRGTSRSAAWRSLYPRFPRLLIILDGALDGASERSLATRLATRTADLAAHTRANPHLTRLADKLSVGVTTLAQLQTQGPFEPIFTPLLRTSKDPVDMLLGSERHS